jgi:stress-induced morphogen
MEWDPEILARLRSSREEVILRRKEIVRRKERNTSARAVSQTNSPEIKMVVGDWCTDQLGNRSRMVYNAKTEDIEAIYALSRKVSAS